MSWKWVRRAVRGGGFVCLLPVAAWAQGVNAGAMTVGPAPALLRISVAVPGFDPAPVSAATTYTIKAGKVTKPQGVSAQLNAAMPVGVTLTVELSAPTGATSNGPVALDATIRELVGNITNITVETQTITYTLTATAAAGVIPFSSRTVTFTVATWP
jgi:hypothetical protein